MLRCSFLVDPRTVTAVFAFILTVLLCAPAGAQTPAPPPIFPAVDGNSVDVATGAFNYSQTDVVIGQPGAGGLAFTRSYQSGPNVFWTNNHVGYVYANGTTCSVVLGTHTETFTSGSNCAGGFVSNQQRGAILTYDSSTGTYTYTASDGTVAIFPRIPDNHVFHGLPAAAVAYLLHVTAPDGQWTGYGYEFSTHAICYPDPAYCWWQITYGNARLALVGNNFGYALALEYPGPPDNMVPPNKITGINRAIEICNGWNCAQTWPAVTYTYNGNGMVATATNAISATTTYTYSGTSLTRVQFPDDANHNIDIGYTSGRISSVDLGFGTWSYAYADAGADRTTTVTDPGNSQRTYVSTITTGRIKSVTNEVGQTLGYQYDTAARQTRVTQPEGNYTEYTLDGRGNITQTRQVSKTPGTPVDVFTSAIYPFSCSNPKTCNKPTSTTDAAGQTTDYTYSSTHGGVLTITAPASSGGADRPQTRFTYNQFQGRLQNGAVMNAVWRPTATSTCSTGSAPACLGTANETVTTLAYQSSGTPNNVLPISQTTASGNGTPSATTTLTYTSWGDVQSVDGPLPGSADTTRFYYNAGRQVVGVVGPDPDGGGPRLHPAQRTTFTAIGQPSLVERGTVTSQSDTAFNSFVALEKQDTVRDTFARPIRSRLWDGGTIVALTQTNYGLRGRVLCTAVRMNPADFANPPADACAQGSAGAFGPDRISRAVNDGAGRLVQSQSGVGTALLQTTAAYEYTPNGQVASLTDARSARTSYEYDGFDRLVKRRYPDPNYPNQSSATDYEQLAYDAFGRILQERGRGGDWFAFGYDNLNRLTLRDAPGGQPDVSYAYDLIGRAIAESQSGNALTTAYDALSRITAVTSSVLGTIAYQYDAAGRRTRMDYPGGFYVTYAYHTTGELITLTESGATSLASYGYDALGRRTTLTRGNGVVTSTSFDAVSRLATLIQDPAGTSHDTSFGFSYNPASQLTSRTRTNGVFDYLLPGSFSESYTADGLNRYTSALGVNPTYGLRGNLTYDGTNTYTYDVDNRLVATSGGASLGYDPLGRLHEVSAAGATTRFLYDGADVIAEYNASGTVLRRYVHGPGTDEPLVWYEGSGTGDRRYLLADERGSIIGVTNGNGDVTQVNRYDAYGVPNPANQGRFQYTGQMWLAEVGLYHYKARLYHPRLGRFMQTDPIGTAGGMNLYAYTGNDPVNGRDPSGLIDCLGGLPSNGNNDSCAPVPPGACYASRINTVPGSGCGGSFFDPTYYNNFADFYAAISERAHRGELREGSGNASEDWRIPLPSWARDPDVRTDMSRAWDASGIQLSPYQRREQGGLVVHYWWADKGDYDVIRARPGTMDEMFLPNTRWCPCDAVGSYHTHPLRWSDGPYDPYRPSRTDRESNLPGIIITFPEPGSNARYQLIPYQGR